MKVLVIYDSEFGNTERVAQAMGEAIGGEVQKVTDVQPGRLAGLDALIVGSPTQKFQPLASIKTFVKDIPPGKLDGVKVAAFDTRIALEDADSAILNFFVKLFGYAAKPIADQLAKKGGELAMPPEGFYVEGTEGPLKEGELERAMEWVKQII
jgi:flavodoxin I